MEFASPPFGTCFKIQFMLVTCGTRTKSFPACTSQSSPETYGKPCRKCVSSALAQRWSKNISQTFFEAWSSTSMAEVSGCSATIGTTRAAHDIIAPIKTSGDVVTVFECIEQRLTISRS